MYLFNILVNLRFSDQILDPPLNYTIFLALPAINCIHFIIVQSQSAAANFIYLLNKQKLQMGVTIQKSKNHFLFVKQACPSAKSCQ